MTSNPVIKTDYFVHGPFGAIAVQTFADGLICVFDDAKCDGEHENGQRRFYGALAQGEDRAELLARFGIKELG